MIRRGLISLLLFSLVFAAQVAGSARDPDLVISPGVAWQGKVITLRLTSAEGVSWVRCRFLNQDITCFRHGDDFRGVVGVPVNQRPGRYDLFLYLYNKDGTLNSIHRQVKVGTTRFPFSRYWLKPAKKKLLAPDLINMEWAQIEKMLKVEGGDQLWQGKFALPVQARISQGFGHRQIVNGRRGGNHRGVDFAVFTGTPIKAPNRGRVVFARRLKAFGGTIVLDHGQGVQTLYFHLSKLYVKVGQDVPKGKVIGLSGDSGVSSGPHLHWGMSVHNLRVDPMQWVNYEI